MADIKSRRQKMKPFIGFNVGSILVNTPMMFVHMAADNEAMYIGYACWTFLNLVCLVWLTR